MMPRIPITEVTPVVECGRYAAKATLDEAFPIGARVFREGHDRLGAGIVLTDPDGRERPLVRMPHVDNDYYGAWVRADQLGEWTFRIESWSDPFGTWLQDAPVKIGADVDTELMLAEGAALLERAADALPGTAAGDTTTLTDAVRALRDERRPVVERLEAGTSPGVCDVLNRYPVRDLLGSSPAHRFRVDRPRALFSSWYEFFPRSEGGTLASAAGRLDAVAEMGFDVVYLPPIHPIGRVNRKGPNNTIGAGPDDPGSPWAIGAAEGGHDAVHPALGTFCDVDAFVARARDLGLEVALDFALQCAPDHPWVAEHPEWFTTRVDGTIAYAENPPKKYQDIYPLNFDNDPEGLYAEIVRVLRVWTDRGIRIFRVDNPHTKPLCFWERLLAEFRASDPDVLFLSEAFTRPAMLQALAAAGFHQSYTYFTWRETKAEIEAYLTEVAHETSAVMRPNFFVNTPDILPGHLQSGDPAMFKVRAALAATGSPSWGVYSGFELYEHVSLRPGSEEYLDSEKYEVRPRDWEAAAAGDRTLAPYLRDLNAVRRAHPALQQLRALTVHRTDSEFITCYSKRATAPDGRDDVVVVAVNLAPHVVHEATVHLDLPALGLSWGDAFDVRDELTGRTWHWGEHNYVRLGPDTEPVHVLAVQAPGPAGGDVGDRAGQDGSAPPSAPPARSE